MIVRILGERQYELPESARDQLDELDRVVDAAVSAGDAEAFHRALEALVGAIRASGTPLDATRIVPSDLFVPRAGASLDEVRDLLDSEVNAES